MTPKELARLHQRCFTMPRAYTADEFSRFLDSDTCFLCPAKAGFALGRAIADEAELLTLAVDLAARRKGLGRLLLAEFERQSHKRGAMRAFLEVAAGNEAAIGLYQSAGYTESGRRTAYYWHPDGHREDAVMMEKRLTAA